MRRSRILLVSLFLSLAVILAGCFGKPTNPPGNPGGGDPGSTTAVNGTVKTSKATIGAKSVSGSKDVAGDQAPFAGAKVELYKVNGDGTKTLFAAVTATTDENGNYTLSGLPNPEPDVKYILKVSKTVNGSLVTMEVQLPELKAGATVTQNADPILNFATKVTDGVFAGLRDFTSSWWDMTAKQVTDLQALLVTKITGIINDSFGGKLPDFTKPAEVVPYMNAFMTMLNSDAEVRGMIVEALLPNLNIVSFSADGTPFVVANDPTGDGIPASSLEPAEDITRLEMSLSGTQVTFKTTFNADTSLGSIPAPTDSPTSSDYLCINMSNVVKTLYTNVAGSSKMFSIWVYADGYRVFLNNQPLYTKESIVTVSGKTVTVTLDLADLSIEPSYFNTAGVFVIKDGKDFTPTVRLAPAE